ncbi:hypothetical protein F4824DRAFT_503011 [Ustulina deusta]|nr:hypothetical protein F4824DRAFT_503011 [Ustulina deusta]
MPPVTNPNQLDETHVLSQLSVGLLTGQDSCPVIKECDNGCSRHIDVLRCRLIPNGNSPDRD